MSEENMDNAGIPAIETKVLALHRPTIAIVGRPNVGKSSLFNAILNRRLAIVHEMSGVTRDRISAPVFRNGRRFNLVDTGGLGMMTGETRKVDFWDANIAQQVEAAVADADVLIMVGDAQAGVTPLEQDIAVRLRSSGRPVLVAVNKCDSPQLKDDAAEFSVLGFPKVYPICCKHRGGIAALLEEAVKQLPPGMETPPPSAVSLAVIGRPNVGKSSLVNALLGSERVMTSDVAGTTRDAVEIDFSIKYRDEYRPAVLVDTAGLRKTAKVDDLVEYFSVMRAKSAIERADLILFVVDSSGDGVTAQDRRISGLIQKANKPCVIVANKSDACEGKKRSVLLEELRDALPHLGTLPAVSISAKKKQNLDQLLDAVADVMEQLEVEISTGVLNRVLAAAMEKRTPPVTGTRPLKLYYAAMVGMRPARIKLFVNKPDGIPDNYVSYLRNQLREAFGLFAVPILLEFCARPKKVESIRHRENAEKKRKKRR